MPDDGLLFGGENDPRSSHPLAADNFTSQELRENDEAQLDLSMTHLKNEANSIQQLPTFVERIGLLSKLNTKGRWFPYLYEVIIFQWVAVLMEQKRSNETKAEKRGSFDDIYKHGRNLENKSLRNAAARARGFAISCAPVLLELIKNSLGWRLHSLLSKVDSSVSTTLNDRHSTAAGKTRRNDLV